VTVPGFTQALAAGRQAVADAPPALPHAMLDAGDLAGR
jgi:hypothetical protein